MTWRLGLAAGIVSLGVYAYAIEPDWLDITEHRFRAGHPGSRLTIAQISDLHLHKIGQREESVLSALDVIRPDLTVLTGDILDNPSGFSDLEVFLSRLPGTKIAILGNWEYWGGIDLEQLRQTYSRHGVQLLVNSCRQVVVDTRVVTVLGLDDASAGQPDFNKALSACPSHDSLLVLEHSPAYSSQEPVSGAAPMMNLAGHTHGGQFALFGATLTAPPGSSRFTAGWYETAWGPLYVSRGVGTSIIPLRLGARPELAIFSIQE